MDACHQFRPYSYTLSDADLQLARNLCGGAPEGFQSDCIEGMSHSYGLMQAQHGGLFVGKG